MLIKLFKSHLILTRSLNYNDLILKTFIINKNKQNII